jgi:prepilin-type N-terminal cleavage/methylation domain-containing protein
MLARLRKAKEEGEGGFTLIELLVVMIIIGILAAIAIPVFLNQRKKAQDSAAKADVSTIGKEIATYFVDGTGVPTIAVASGRYTLTPPGAGATAVDLGKASTNVALDAVVAGAGIVDASHWCVAVTNDQGATQDYKYSARGGLETGNCAAADVA